MVIRVARRGGGGGCVFMANNIMSNLNGNVATTSLNELLGTEKLGVITRGLSPCVGISPNAVDPCRRNRMCMARSNTRASLSLNRCRHFVSRSLGGCSGLAANGICSGILRGRHRNSCLNGAIRMVPRVAGRVGSFVCGMNRGAGTSIMVARVNNAINSVRDRPFLRTVHRMSLRINERGDVFVRMALIPCVGNDRRRGSGPARRSMGRLHSLNVGPSVVILHYSRPLRRDVFGGVTLFYGMGPSYMVRGVALPALCRTPLVLRGDGFSGIMYHRLGVMASGGPSLSR